MSNTAGDTPGQDLKAYPSEDREIYPSAPLSFVAFELTFPPVLALQDEAVKREVFARLREILPIPAAAPLSVGGFSVQLSAAGAQGAPMGPGALGSPPGLRMLNRDRTASVTITPQSLLVETSAYGRFERFRDDLISEALATLGQVEVVPGMQRIGLRYIDEIRIEGVEQPADWTPYIDGSLHGPIGLLESPARVTQGLVEYGVADQRQLVLRYGATTGWAVDPNGPLRLSTNDAGAFFLLDIDSFWSASPELLPEYSHETALHLCNELHKPIRQLFEASITDKLRNDVLRKESA